MRCLVLTILVVACGSPAQTIDAPQGGPDAPPPCDTCALLAISPAIANTGDQLVLEGTFADDTVVYFRSTKVQATVLGPHRATVTVPSGATGGTVVVASGGAALQPQPFEQVAYALDLQRFEPLEQASGAAAIPHLATARARAATVVDHGRVYAIGGEDASGPLATIETATIGADGSLAPFATLAMGLVTPRTGAVAIVAGSYLYVIGGRDTSELDTIERAFISGDGTLTKFETVLGIHLTTPRADLAAAVIGDGLYVFGGWTGTAYTGAIERAPIDFAGRIGPFVATGGALATPRGEHAVAVVGAAVYAIGGRSAATTLLDSVERAAIHPDGTLDAFTAVATLGAPRAGAALASAGRTVYVIGGTAAGGPTAAVERATLGTDGMLGGFTAGAPLASPRAAPLAAIAGNDLYVIGGRGATGALASLERASLDGSGALNFFTPVPEVQVIDIGVRAISIGDFVYFIGVSSASRVTIDTADALGWSTTSAPLVGFRVNHALAAIGPYVYVLGGDGQATIERGVVAADGGLAGFAAAGALAAGVRAGHTCAVIGSYLYVLGGDDGTQLVPAVERAAIAADGSLGPFAIVAGVQLGVTHHTSAVIGDGLYVVGGYDGTGAAVADVRRAQIAADGTIGAFAVVPGSALAIPRAEHGSAIVGNALFVFGGHGTTTYPTDAERAPIGADGSLGAFAPAAGLTLALERANFGTAVTRRGIVIAGGGTRVGSTITFANPGERALFH